MMTSTIASQNNSTTFSNLLSHRIQKGFKIVEQNDKLPYVVLSKEPKPINHKLHFFLSCITIGLWAIVWIYVSYKSSKNRKILVAIDEDGKVFEEKCFSE
jgi:hypothetical protein